MYYFLIEVINFYISTNFDAGTQQAGGLFGAKSGGFGTTGGTLGTSAGFGTLGTGMAGGNSLFSGQQNKPGLGMGSTFGAGSGRLIILVFLEKISRASRDWPYYACHIYFQLFLVLVELLRGEGCIIYQIQ